MVPVVVAAATWLLLGRPLETAGAPRLAAQAMSNSSFVMDANGKLYVWGDNAQGQLGLGNIGRQTVPVVVPWPAGVTGWQSVACGGDGHTLALGDDGQIYSCGFNTAGELGLGYTSLRVVNFTRVPLPAGITEWTAVATGAGSSFALAATGQLYAWGTNGFGQLGLNGSTNATSPTFVAFPAGVPSWQAVAAGANHTLALSSDGRLFGTGRNASGQLGNGASAISQKQFALVPFPSGVTQWVAITCSADSSFAISRAGQLYAWGEGTNGELGIGLQIRTNRPCFVTPPPGTTGWKAVSGGLYHTLGLASDNQIYAWGNNNYVPTGAGTPSALVLSPTAIANPPWITNWLTVTAGHICSLAIGDDCQLYAWGRNDYSSLGLPTFYQTSPLALYGLGDLCSPSTSSVPVVTIRAVQPTVSEVPTNNSTTNVGVFEIARTGYGSSAMSVAVNLAGSAIYGIDYRTTPPFSSGAIYENTVLIPAYLESTRILVYPLDDNLAETNQTIAVTVITNRSSAYSVGQPSSATVTILEDNDTNRPPSISLSFPPDGARFATGKNILLGADVSDPDANARTVEFFVDGASVGVINLGSITNIEGYHHTNFTQSASLVLPFLLPGAHVLTAKATDLFGAQATAVSRSFTVLPRGVNPPASPALATEPYAISSYALDASGALYIWGELFPSPLGTNSGNAQLLPIQVPLPSGATAWVQASGGQEHSLAIANNGQLYSWGVNDCGQLGIGHGATTQFPPVPVQSPTPVSGWKKAAAGALFSVAIDNTGRLFAWGNNFIGQLGIGSTVYQYEPVPVPFPPGITNWIDVAAGAENTFVLSDNGALYACGNSAEGELGNNLVGNDVPSGVAHLVPVLLPSGVSAWTRIAAGTFHSFAFGNDGNLYGWGDNLDGEVLGSVSPRVVPTPTLVPPVTAPWIDVAGNDYGSLGLAQDGNVYQWGVVYYGAPPAYTNGLVPVPPGATRWRSIAGASYHSLAIADNCQVYAWGENNYGQLGNGTTSTSIAPVPVQLLGDLCSAPSIGIISPTDGSIFAAPATIPVTAAADSHDNQVVGVDFFANNQLISHAGAAPYSFTWTNVLAGNYTLTAVATDNLNAASTSTQVQISVISIVPVVRVFPRFQVSPDDDSLTVIAANYSNALVVLDASLSTNSPGAPMSFAWFSAGAPNPFAVTAVAKDLLALGNPSVELEMTVEGLEVSTNANLHIITTGQAVADLVQRIAQSGLDRQLQMLLSNPLLSAQRAFDSGRPGVGIVQLGIFQNRTDDHLASTDPALAADYIHVAQGIIDAAEPIRPHAAALLAVQATAGARGHLVFSGSAGQVYLLEASTNLQDWQVIGVATESTPGQFEFNDPNTVASPYRFYRLVAP